MLILIPALRSYPWLLWGILFAAWIILPLARAQDGTAPDANAIPTATTEGATTIVTDANWAPYDYNLDITRGSVFDFSAINDAPAGKYGPVIVAPNGHFEFKNQPGVHARFWGVNICTQALFMDKDKVDVVADRMMRSGYNVVRIHHFDRDLLKPNSTSYDIDPAQLDRLEYFVYALEKRGIYINFDLYSLRNFSDAEAVSFGWPAERDKSFDRGRWFKATVPVSDAAFDSWKQFAQNLLTHRNPYTGLTWAEDPAIVGICPLNEDTLAAHVMKVPALLKLYEDKFTEWQSDLKNRDLVNQNEASAFNEFLLETEMKNDARMRDFLRSIGVQAPITGCNYIDSEIQAYLRANYDYVDDHDYWDMPIWLGTQWSVPFTTHDADPVKDAAKMPRDLMPSRVFGKPFTITEYSYVWPTSDRGVGGVLMSTYASLQDWDGIYYFAYAGKVDAILNPGRTGVLDLAPDPINLLADRVASLIFRRGDVKPAANGICWAVNKDAALGGGKGIWHGFPKEFSMLGLVTRIGNSTAKPETILSSDIGTQTGLSAVLTEPKSDVTGNHIYKFSKDVADQLQQDKIIPKMSNDHYVSETGQIDLGATSGTLKVITDKSECFSLPAKEKLNGNFVAIQNGDLQSTVSVVAVDDKPLKESHRVLVLHLTNSLNMGTRFKTPAQLEVDDWGTLPHMVRRGETDITFQVTDPEAWKAWAVDASGNHLGEMELTKVDGGFLLKADTFFKDGTCLAYELVRGGN